MKYRKFKNSEISYVFYKTLALSVICRKCGNKDEKMLKKKKESFEILKICDLINIEQCKKI